MEIIEEMLKEIEEEEVDEQMRHLSDKVQEDEDEYNPPYYDEDGNQIRPAGPNIFLSIACKGQLKNQKAYLTLERDFPEDYFVGMWAEKNDGNYHRIKNWNVREHKPKKIMREYAKILKSFGRKK